MNLGLTTIFASGMLTFFTPCVLPLVPIYLAAMTGGQLASLQKKRTTLVRATAFSIGFTAVFTLLGIGASSIGALLNQYQLVMQGVGALLITLFGLKFLGVIKIPFLDNVVKADETRFKSNVGLINAFVMGVVFAAGWSPCVGPVLGTVLTYTAANTTSWWEGALYLTVYGMGFAIPLLLTAAFASVAQTWLGRLNAFLPRIEKAIGVLLLLVAGSMVTDISSLVSPPGGRGTPDARPLAEGARSNDLPTMVELYKEDCGACQKMKPVVEQIVRQCDNKGVHIRKLDISKPENLHLVNTYRLRGVPTFVFLDEDGREASRLIGVQSKEALKSHLSRLREDPCPNLAMATDPQSAHDFDRPLPSCNI